MRLRPWGSLQHSPCRPLVGFKGAASRRGGEGKGERRGAGTEEKRRGGEVVCDAQLEQGCRLAKAGPAHN